MRHVYGQVCWSASFLTCRPGFMGGCIDDYPNTPFPLPQSPF